ncbi:hypothetical protein MSAS_46950 [Mycobacterium saskatchewanense]|nr:helix-turn-helix domain-containing protein [Mycobacterium saskatchewanense]BBX65521.1 hypothetical protein MSAS_46950 [Mycobacterium saskatchewanense]
MDQRMATLRVRLRDRHRPMVEEMLQRMRVDIPAFFSSDDPDFVTLYTASCYAHLGLMLDQMTSDRVIPEALPTAAVEETRAVAQWGISLEALIQTYRTGHSVIWEHTMDVAEQTIDESTVRSQVLKLSSRYLFAYFDRMIVLVTEVYEGERLSLFRESDRRRRQMVRDLLDGLPIDQSKLPYRLTDTHMAAISIGEGSEGVIRRLAARSGLSCLTVRGPTQSVWAWIGGKNLRDVATQKAVVAAVPSTTFVAFGEVGEGLEGFRISHREAREAYRIGRQLGSRTLQYADVALLSLTSHDATLAREFIQRELGFLAEDDQRAEELRTTVRAYFDAGHNASATANRLSLNDRTVGYRLRTVEEKLGRPLLSRRDELSVALRLHELYASKPDTPAADDLDQL